MSTNEQLRAHRLVSTRWRVRRSEGDPAWLAHPVGSDDRAAKFDKLSDALGWAADHGRAKP